MSRTNISILVLSALVLLGLYSMRVFSQGEPGTTTTTVVQKTITTPVPSAKEVVEVPTGYEQCTQSTAGWYNGVWVPSHKLCTYTSTNTPGSEWVDGYWGCNTYTDDVCTNWQWIPAHWEKTPTQY